MPHGGEGLAACGWRDLLRRRGAASWLIAVAALGLLQPFLLGFYLDDWSLMGQDAAVYDPFSRQLWNAIVAHDPTRPVSIVFRWVSGSLFRDVPGLWHAALVTANVSIAFGVAALVRLLLPASAPLAQALALPLTAAWMTLPWTSGIRFWPTTLNLQTYLAVFVWLMVYLLRQWRLGRGPLVVPFLVYLAICLGYEAFYLQFVVLGIVALAQVRCCALQAGPAARSIGALAAAQALALGWNQFARTHYASPRNIASDWLPLMARNLKVAVPEMVGSFGPARWLAAVAFAVLMAGIASALWKAVRRRSLSASDLASTGVILLAFVIGMVASAAVFSVGGRPFSGFGVEARGMSVLSLWSVAAMGLLVGVALVHAAGLPRRVLIAGLWLSAVSLLAGQLMQFRDWHQAARLQARVLSLVPVAAMADTEPDAKILCVFPSEIRGAPVFSSPWDLNSAMHVTYPALAGKHFIGYSPWGGELRWDGAKIWSEWFPENAMPAPVLYLWRPFHGEFRKVERPIAVRYDLQWRYTD